MEFRARLRIWLIALTAASGLLWAFSTVTITVVDLHTAHVSLRRGVLRVTLGHEHSRYNAQFQEHWFDFGVLPFQFRDSLGLIWPYKESEYGVPLAWVWLTGLFGLALLRLFPARTRAGVCGCGYDLTGNRSGVCPECGRAVRGAIGATGDD